MSNPAGNGECRPVAIGAGIRMGKNFCLNTAKTTIDNGFQ